MRHLALLFVLILAVTVDAADRTQDGCSTVSKNDVAEMVAEIVIEIANWDIDEIATSFTRESWETRTVNAYGYLNTEFRRCP